MLIWIFISLFADIFRRQDLSGVAKAGWLILIILLPFLGALIYVSQRPSGDRQRDAAGWSTTATNPVDAGSQATGRGRADATARSLRTDRPHDASLIDVGSDSWVSRPGPRSRSGLVSPAWRRASRGPGRRGLERPAAARAAGPPRTRGPRIGRPGCR